MKTSVFKKFGKCWLKWAVVVMGLMASSLSYGEIIILYGPQDIAGMSSILVMPNSQITAPLSTAGTGVLMSSIVMHATRSSSPVVTRHLQRSHAWSVYQDGSMNSGIGLVYPPYATAPLSPAEASVWGNVLRAQAFRQGYFK